MEEIKNLNFENLLVLSKKLSELNINDDNVKKSVRKNLLSRCPFIRIQNPDATKKDVYPEPKKFLSESNWVICDYGDMIATSPGYLLYDGGFFVVFIDDDEGGTGSATNERSKLQSLGSINPGQGTLTNQMMKSANDVVNLLVHKKWKTAKIIAGSKKMKWMFHFIAQKSSISVTGYHKTKEDTIRESIIELPLEKLSARFKKRLQNNMNKSPTKK